MFVVFIMAAVLIAQTQSAAIVLPTETIVSIKIVILEMKTKFNSFYLNFTDCRDGRKQRRQSFG